MKSFFFFYHGKLGVTDITLKYGKVQEHSKLFLPYKTKQECLSPLAGFIGRALVWSEISKGKMLIRVYEEVLFVK